MQVTSQGVSTYQHMSMFDAMDEKISQKVKPESWSVFFWNWESTFFSIQSHFNKNLQCVETQIIFQGFLDLFSELWKQEKNIFNDNLNNIVIIM